MVLPGTVDGSMGGWAGRGAREGLRRRYWSARRDDDAGRDIEAGSQGWPEGGRESGECATDGCGSNEVENFGEDVSCYTG